MDIVEFAEQFRGYKLTKFQKNLLLDLYEAYIGEKKVHISFPRQCGRTATITAFIQIVIAYEMYCSMETGEIDNGEPK